MAPSIQPLGSSLRLWLLVGFICALLPRLTEAQSATCSTIAPSGSIKPTVASGYRVAVVATGLTKPRGIEFDSAGNLLVVEQGSGMVWLSFKDQGGECLSVADKGNVINDNDLNHGIQLSEDGRTLYASSAETAWSWDYNSNTKKAENRKSLVTNMQNNDHTSRTLLLSRKVNGTLLISRGSMENVDLEAATPSSGHSQIKSFDVNSVPATGYSYDTDGLRIGWGLRNSVGVAEHPVTGGIYSVENSVDQIQRDGVDIHQDNPGEEMNFHGYLNGTTYWAQGLNYGYPFCYAAWVVSDIPNNSNLSVGSQFAMDVPGDTKMDSYCAAQVPPRLTFQAHMAPLDIKFNNSGTEGWVTFHGSWDRTDPVGYKLSVIPFSNGEPVAASNNSTAATDILVNQDNSVCPSNCFRPVGIAFDSQGRLFMSSDASGEIYVVVREGSVGATQTGSQTSTQSGTQTGSQTGSAPAASSSKSDGSAIAAGTGCLYAGVIVFVALCLM